MLAYLCRIRALRCFKKIACVVLLIFFYQIYYFYNKLRFQNEYNPANESISDKWQINRGCIVNDLTRNAVQRARTTDCKRMITNVSCWHQQDILFPDELPYMCPSNRTRKDFLLEPYYLGCSTLNDSVFVSEFSYKVKRKHAVRMCWKSCHLNGFQYSGLNGEVQCYCSNQKPINLISFESSDVKCDENDSVTVYKTGVRIFSNETMSNNRKAKIVFLLTLNGRGFRQVKRLLSALYRREHFYLVHVDARQDYLFRQLLPYEKSFPNFKVIRKRYSTIWGGASLLTMLLIAMKRAANDYSWDWDYIMNLSETDYPLKSVDRLSEFLGGHINKNFLREHSVDRQQFIRRQGLQQIFVECDYHMWRIGGRKLPSNVIFTGGSDWFVFSRGFVEYLTDEENHDELIRGMLQFFRFTLLPAETFFHSVLMNSNLCQTFVDSNLRLINWKRKFGCRCQYKKIVDWCGCSPNVLKVDDWDRLLKTENKTIFFGRKFEPVIDQTILFKIDVDLLHRNFDGVSKESLENYWENMYHYADISVQSNEALIYFGKLVIVKQVTDMNCKTNITGNLNEIHHLFTSDKFQGALVQYSLNNSAIEIETWLRIKSNDFVSDFGMFFVTSNFDQKENIARNFFRIFDQYSDLVIVYELIGSQRNVSVSLIDPDGNYVRSFSIKWTKHRSFLELPIGKPLKVGQWSIELFDYNLQRRFSQKPFWVFSSDFLQPTIADWNRIAKFYQIKQTCVVKNRNFSLFQARCSLKNLPDCRHTSWSSFSADPKSEFI